MTGTIATSKMSLTFTPILYSTCSQLRRNDMRSRFAEIGLKIALAAAIVLAAPLTVSAGAVPVARFTTRILDERGDAVPKARGGAGALTGYNNESGQPIFS